MSRLILRSSYDAIMEHDCPLGHGVKGDVCRDKHGDMVSNVVCPERRALVNIYQPGLYVEFTIPRQASDA